MPVSQADLEKKLKENLEPIFLVKIIFLLIYYYYFYSNIYRK